MPLKFSSELDDSRFQAGLKRMERGIASLASGLSIGAITAFGKSVIDLAGNIQDSAANLNLSIASYQQLQQVFGEAGTSAQKFDLGIAKLVQSMEDAKNGSPGVLEALDKLGISYSEIAGEETEEQLLIIADAMKNAKDPAAALDAVITLLGKSGKNMAGAMKEGAAAIREAKKEMPFMSEEETKNLDSLGDRFARGFRRMQSEAGRVMSGVLKGIDDINARAEKWLNPASQFPALTKPDLEEPPPAVIAKAKPFVADPRDVKAHQDRLKEIEKINAEWSREADNTAKQREDSERKLQENITRIYADEAERRRREGMDALNDEMRDRENALGKAQAVAEGAQRALVDFNLATPDERRQARRDALDQRRAESRANRMLQGGARDARAGAGQLIAEAKAAENKVMIEQKSLDALAKTIALEVDKLIVRP